MNKTEEPTYKVHLRADIFIALVVFTVALMGLSSPSRMLSWDEVDYIQAARQGFISNALDTTSLRTQDFIELTKAKIRGLPPKPPTSGYKEEDDVFLLRHFHPPLLQFIGSFQALIPITQTRLASLGAFTLRWMCGVGLIIIAYKTIKEEFGGPNKTFGRIMFSFYIVYAACLLSIYLQYHVLMAISLIVAARSLIRCMKYGDISSHLGVSFSLSLCILSLETSLVVMGISIVVYLLARLSRLNNGLKKSDVCNMLGKCITYFLVIPCLLVIVVWPGSVSKLSLVRTVAMYTYRVFWVKEEYSTVFMWGKISVILMNLLPLMFGAAIVVIITSKYHLSAMRVSDKGAQIEGLKAHSGSLEAIIFIFIGVGYTFCMAPFMLDSTYMVPGLLVASMPLAAYLDKHSFQLWVGSNSQIGILFFLLLSISTVQLSTKLLSEAEYPGWQAISDLESYLSAPINDKLPTVKLYADGGHVFRYYLQKYAHNIEDISRIEFNASDPDKVAQIYIRENQGYQRLNLREIKEKVIIITRQKYSKILMQLEKTCAPTGEVRVVNGVTCTID